MALKKYYVNTIKWYIIFILIMNPILQSFWSAVDGDIEAHSVRACGNETPPTNGYAHVDWSDSKTLKYHLA